MEFPPIKTKEGYIIRHEAFECSLLWNYIIFDENDRELGRCIVIKREDYRKIIDEDEEIFLDIVTFNEKDRGKGIAGILMKFVCEYGNHPILISSSFNKKGRDFGFKYGWKIKKAINKKQNDILYYRKEK